MSGALHAPFCADQAVQVKTEVREIEQVARGTYRIRFAAPEIAERIFPGQFVMLRMAGTSDPLIGRALAMYDVIEDAAGRPEAIDVIFIKKGKFTTAVAEAGRGAALDVWGPLGNGFSIAAAETLLIAVGGVGQTPMLALAAEALGRRSFGRPSGYAQRVTMVYGARSGDLLACTAAFRAAGIDLRLCTDDGSAGERARVPELVERLIEALPPPAGDSVSGSAQGSTAVRIVSCGPEIMMEKVAAVAADRSIPCEVSLETPMACGIGICFSCVARVRQDDGEWDYKRTCVEGPVFDAARIVW
ncbi:dihydroorotate dehydrogenase electron transfer subunit [Candidatus Laterigemmans baculatus]|uniref:dihydroorotate dehydrogenase electron transfer subunit n=1 Tax=Candidatus Laterigemmans baculatus TaxID=2770505 RepID=UPI0013DD857E|nr:dihydroorotate dehydrogenase electron transfer subunit [Candidatus Laterigemmans baculatus]